MILTLAYCAKDKAIAIRLAIWIVELGGTGRHDCLLGYHQDTDPSEIADILAPNFSHIGAFKIVEDATTYPEAANMMWKSCANKVADEFNEPWLWMEPDGVPLRADWLDEIEKEYRSAGKPFMLDRVITPKSTHNSGTGVYPARVRDYTQRLWQLAGSPWDVFLAPDFTPHTHHTKLIQDKFYRVWDDYNSGEPTFPDAESLSILEPDAVIFHRNKDGTLIERLRESRGGVISTRRIHSSEIASETLAPATPPTITLADLARRVEILEQQVAGKCASASVPVQAGNRVFGSSPALKPTRSRRQKKPRETREQMLKRMAELRARKVAA